MNHEEAKFILQAYRLGGQDAADPQFREALEQLKYDPELARWFAEERAIESCIQAKLKAAVRPSSHLKARLLTQRKVIRPVLWWRQPAWLAGAAVVVLVATLAALWIKPWKGLQFPAFRLAMVRSSLNMADHGTQMVHDVSRILGWLKQREVDPHIDLPAPLRNTPIQGCGVVNWRGHKVMLICFKLNGSAYMDLFITDRAHFRGFSPTEAPQFAQADGLTTASWTRGERTYLLASTADESALRKYL